MCVSVCVCVCVCVSVTYTLFLPSLHPTEASDFSLRLVGGEREGIVEVAYNGRWGTVCEDELWSIANVQVACEELGLTTESGYSTIPSTRYTGSTAVLTVGLPLVT